MNAKAFLVGLAVVLVVAAGIVAWSGRGPGDAGHGTLGERVEPRLESAQIEARGEPLEAAIVPDSSADETSRTAVAADAMAPGSDEQATLIAAFVSAETGAPLAGQRCSARRDGGVFGGRRIDASEGGLGVTPRSGGDGLVRFTLAPGSYAVHPDDDAVEPQEAPDLVAGETRRLTFVVRTRCDLVAHVLVIDVESERPLPEIELRLRGLPSSLADATRSARTGGDGRASLRVPSWLFVGGGIEADGYGPARFRLLPMHDAPETALVIRLSRAASLRGRVVDARGTSVASVRVLLSCLASELGARDTELGNALFGRHHRYDVSERTWTARTGTDGAFEITGLPAGVRLEVALDGPEGQRGEAPVRLAPGEVREVTYRTGGGAVVRGVLLGADGEPCPEVELCRVQGRTSRMQNALTIEGKTARTDDDGAFQMRDVPPGDWLVGPRDPRNAATWMTHVFVPVGAPSVEVVLRLPGELWVAGRVVGPNGEGVARVSLIAVGGGVFTDGSSGEDGAFELGPVPAGDVTISTIIGTPDWAGLGPVLAQAGDRDVVVPVVSPGELLVRVRDEAGRPIEAEVLRSRVDQAQSDGISFAATDGDGELTMSNLGPGLHHLLARVEGGLVGAAGPVRVESGARAEIDVTVRAGGRLRIGAAASSEFDVMRVSLDGRYTDIERLDAAGEITTRPLPPGTAQVELVRADGSIDVRDATVIAGETVDVAFD